MSNKCITDTTPIFEFTSETPINFDRKDKKQLNAIAKQISVETGVPQKMIYSDPHLFFINRWHKLDNEWYFFKDGRYDFYFFNELLGVEVSKYFGLDTIQYRIAKRQIEEQTPQLGLLSKNFCDKDLTYRQASEYGIMHQYGLGILNDIRRLCSSEEEYISLSNDIKTFFIRDYATSQLDRTNMNFLFKETPEGIRLAPLYDYEQSYEALDPQNYANFLGRMRITDPTIQEQLRTDSKFQELLNALMVMDINKLLSNVQTQHQIDIPEDYSFHYNKRTKEIKQYVKKNNLLK